MDKEFGLNIKLRAVIFLLCSSLFFYFTSLQNTFGSIFYFVLFLPFLFFERSCKDASKSSAFYLPLVYFALFLGNSLSMVWMHKLGWSNIISISLFYSLTFLPLFYLHHLFKKKNIRFSNLIFLLGWVSIELLHSHIAIGLPILSIGYGIATHESIIQWYEFFGVYGGSIWILGINLLLFNLILNYKYNRNVFPKNAIYFLSVLIVPMLVSFLLLGKKEEVSKTKKVLSIHTNLDCYNQKYDVTIDSVQNYYLNLIRSSNPQKVDLVLLPENAYPTLDWMSSINSGENSRINNLDNFRESYEIENLLIGGIGYSIYNGDPKDNLLANYSENSKKYILRYNMALNISDSGTKFRTKERLVPFEETIPYPKLNWLFKSLYNSKGGFNFSTIKRNNFALGIGEGEKVGPLICFESAYGLLASKMVRKGSGLLAVMLNEGWYDTMSGALKFENIAKVRAIENRRWVVRSSNRGMSSIISSKGELIKRKQKEDDGGILYDVPIQNRLSFFTRFGTIWYGSIVIGFICFLGFGFYKLGSQSIKL